MAKAKGFLSRRTKAESPPENFFGRVQISIEDDVTNRAIMNSIRQFLGNYSPAIMASLACSPGLYRYSIFTSIFSFVIYHSDEPTPRTIPNRFGKIAIVH